MQEKEFQLEGGSLFYEKRKDIIVITGFQGRTGEVTLPASIEGLPVSAIGKKAFLSRKYLRKISLPDSITQIDDWAFAYCGGLREINLPNRDISFGRTVFMECTSLTKISFAGAGEDIPALLAAAVSVFEAYYLLDIREASDSVWLEKWDAKLLSVMRTPDNEGYSKQVLCGEEDYGSTDFEAFLSGARKRKARLAFLRLLHPAGLADRIREELEDYLRAHTKGCESEESWQVLLTEYGNDRAYYSMFAEISCITEENFQALLSDVGEELAEMKAFFLRWKEEKIGRTDFFDMLSL